MKDYKNFSKLNKPIRFVGLSPMQFLIMFIIVAITFVATTSARLSFLITLIILLVEIIPIVIYASRASREHKKGNSKYFDSLSNFISTPKRIVDTDTFTYFIKKNTE